MSRTPRLRPVGSLPAALLLIAALDSLPGAQASAAPGWVPDLLAAGEHIEPHRAAYDLSLDRGRSAPDVASAVGRLEFEWVDVCSGWTVQQRSRVLLDRAEGPRVDFGWTLNAWEAKGGERYRFIIRRYLDGMKTEETRGEAELEAPGGAGHARFEEPADYEVALPPGTVFPTMHSLEIIARAEREELPFWRLVFDGAGEEAGLAGVSAVPIRSNPPARGQGDPPLLGEAGRLLGSQPSWRVQLAFFAPGEIDALPLHEQTLTLYRNGVADDLLFDYGDFSLRARLIELETLPDPGC